MTAAKVPVNKKKLHPTIFYYFFNTKCQVTFIRNKSFRTSTTFSMMNVTYNEDTTLIYLKKQNNTVFCWKAPKSYVHLNVNTLRK